MQLPRIGITSTHRCGVQESENQQAEPVVPNTKSLQLLLLISGVSSDSSENERWTKFCFYFPTFKGENGM